MQLHGSRLFGGPHVFLAGLHTFSLKSCRSRIFVSSPHFPSLLTLSLFSPVSSLPHRQSLFSPISLSHPSRLIYPQFLLLTPLIYLQSAIPRSRPSEHFDACGAMTDVVAFQSLGKDAFLVVPCPNPKPKPIPDPSGEHEQEIVRKAERCVVMMMWKCVWL